MRIDSRKQFLWEYETKGEANGTVSVEAANFRARPELNVLGTLLKGDRVRILQGVNGDGISWYYVRVATGANANKTGYVSTGCVTLDAVSTGYATLD